MKDESVSGRADYDHLWNSCPYWTIDEPIPDRGSSWSVIFKYSVVRGIPLREPFVLPQPRLLDPTLTLTAGLSTLLRQPHPPHPLSSNKSQ